MEEDIKILIRFPNKEMTAKEYIQFSKKILQQLKAFSDDFKTLYAWGSEVNAGKYLKDDLSDFESTVFEQLNDKEIAYMNPDKSNKNFTLDSKCFIGYSNTYSTNKDYKLDKISITIGAGKDKAKKEDVGILNFQFSKSLQHKLNLSKLIELLEFCIDLVNPVYAIISSFKFTNKVNKEDDNIEIGWITYIDNKGVANLLPKDIGKKIFPNGSVVFWLSKEKALSTDDKAVEKAIQIRNILGEKGLLNYPS